MAGNQQLALDSHMQALRIRQEIGDKNGCAASMNNIGLIYRDLGDTDKAIDFFNEALEIYQSSGNQQAAGFVLNNIGDVLTLIGKGQQAVAQYKTALAIFEKMDDKRGIAITSQNIGQFYYSAKRYNEAKPFYSNALQCAQAINDLEISKNVSFDLFNLCSSLFHKCCHPASSVIGISLYIAVTQDICIYIMSGIPMFLTLFVNEVKSLLFVLNGLDIADKFGTLFNKLVT